MFNIMRQPFSHTHINLSLYKAVARQTFRNQNNQLKIKCVTALYYETVVCDLAPTVSAVPTMLIMLSIPIVSAVPDHP